MTPGSAIWWQRRSSGDGAHIHAEDVQDWLLQSGYDAAEIAIKTAEKNDLNQPENLDLLAPTNRVRVIITKAALQEGWDCPFAYVLCSLAASSNLAAMTQLVGRILRQPYATKTGIEALDECHVITHHADTGNVVKAIKKGLEKDGLADLAVNLVGGVGTAQGAVNRRIDRRDTFKNAKIYLPRVLRMDGDTVRALDYETDLLAAIDWRDYDPATIAAKIPDAPLETAQQMQRIGLTEDGIGPVGGDNGPVSTEVFAFDPAYATRVISDLVPNPFVGREIVEGVLSRLRARGFDAAKLGRHASLIIDEMRRELDAERARLTERLFKREVAAGRIQFRLRLDGKNWRMPSTVQTTIAEDERQLLGRNGGGLEKSVFAPVYEVELNKPEQGVAVMLDGDKAISWWHRNVAMASVGYGLQGWKRGRIYPDFIFATRGTGEGRRIVALETKGDHLQNPDTDYKRDLMNFLTENFQWQDAIEAGQVNLDNTGETVACTLILMADIATKLPEYLSHHSNDE